MYSLENLGLIAHDLLVELKGENLLMEVILEEFRNAVFDILANKEPTRDEEILETVKTLLEGYKVKTWTSGEFYLICKKYIEIMKGPGIK